MIVDAHHHFWDPATADYPWLTDDLAPIRRAFGPADLEPDLLAAGVDATVLVQTRSSLEETVDFLAVAGETPFVRGVVGWVDLTQPGRRRHDRGAAGRVRAAATSSGSATRPTTSPTRTG